MSDAGRTVVFHRSFQRFAGHHLKVWHYFRYLLDAPGWSPQVVMTQDSVWDESNPWFSVPDRVLWDDRSVEADVYFFSGPLWRPLAQDRRPASPVPVIQYVQSLRHALPDNIRSARLSHKAIRICVSEHVEEALRETGQARGPMLTIPAAIDVGELQRRFPAAERDTDLLIAAMKQPEMGRRAAERLSRPGRSVRLLDELVPHDEFLDAMRRAKVTLFLPFRDEGAPLPMLEGMAVGTFVVCPDAIGNRGYCIDAFNCFRPAYEEEAVLAAAEAAVEEYNELGPLLANAAEVVRRYDLPAERDAFMALLRDVDRMWAAD
jgi:glycosyltransferase involved in cell wall biosynthesis